MALMKVLNENGEWELVKTEPIEHTHAPGEVGADSEGSAAQALSDAKSYTDSEIDKIEAKIPTVSYPVTSVNGKTGAVSLTASDVGADPSGSADAALASAKTYADSAATEVKNDLLNGAGTAYDTLKELGDLIDDNQDAISALETVATGKADAEHGHDIADVSGLQSALDGKAASSHGTHVSYSTTAPVMDGTASAGSASTVARSDHKHPTDTSRAAASDLASHTVNTTVHITSTERTNWNAAKTHADSAHAPSNAQANQNAFSNVTVGSTTIAADTTTDTLTLVAGSNITLTPDATNDKITISATDTVYTHPTTSGNKHIPSGGSSGQILRWSADGTAVWGADNNTTYSAATTSANGLMTSAMVTKLNGIATGANAYTHPSYTAITGKPTANQTPAFGGTATVSQITSDATGHVTGASDRTITIPSTLSNGTGTAGLIKTSSTVTSSSGYTACPVISGVPYYKDTNTTYSLSSFGVTATAAELNTLDGITATVTELNYCDGVTSNIQTQLNAKFNASNIIVHSSTTSLPTVTNGAILIAYDA